MADLPEFNSDAFYDIIAPNAKSRTRDSYRVYLNRYSPGDDIVKFIQNSKSIAEKTEKARLLMLSKDWIPDYDEMKPIIEATFKKYVKQRRQGINITQQDELDRTVLYFKILKTIFDYDNFPLSGWTLFGKYLPPRRRDIIGFKSLDKRVEGQNCYERSTDTFVFYEYKTKRFQKDENEIQEYKLSDLIFIDPMHRDNIRDFLNQNENIVPKITENYFTSQYKAKNGGTINDHRHAWAAFGRNKLSRVGHCILANWMDHTVGMSVQTYSL